MKLTLISLDDWQGIYDEDKLITQGHSIDYREVLEYLGHTVLPYYIEDDDLSEFGNQLPSKKSEILDYINGKNKKLN